MLHGNTEFIINVLLGVVGVSFIILMLLEALTAENPPKPTVDKRDWQLDKEKEDTEAFNLTNHKNSGIMEK